jgi:hypothetical protein
MTSSVATYALAVAFDENVSGVFTVDGSALDGLDGLTDVGLFAGTFDDVTLDAQAPYRVVFGTDNLMAAVQPANLTVTVARVDNPELLEPEQPGVDPERELARVRADASRQVDGHTRRRHLRRLPRLPASRDVAVEDSIVRALLRGLPPVGLTRLPCHRADGRDQCRRRLQGARRGGRSDAYADRRPRDRPAGLLGRRHAVGHAAPRRAADRRSRDCLRERRRRPGL